MKYEISKGTLAIVPEKDERSLVYEDDEKYIIEESPYKIMEESCKYFGSTYKGRKESSKAILGADYKVPIIIEDTNNLIVFPTAAPKSDDCVWISLKRVKRIEKYDVYSTRIIFDTDRESIVPCSYRSIENQLSRASRLDVIMRKRLNS